MALVVLGALFIGFGVLAKPYLYDRLAVVPLDQDSQSVSVGTGVDALWPHGTGEDARIDKLTDVSVTSTRTIKGIPGVVEEAGVADTEAFWQTTVRSQAEVDGRLVDLSYSDAGVSVDRRTGEATNCCGDYASAGDLTDPDLVEPRTYEGNYFKFPFDTKQQDYAWWDGAVGRADPIRFVEEDEVEGVRVYVFRQSIGPETVDTLDIPAYLFDATASGSVEADAVYSNTRTLWVEPVTGVLVDGQEEVSLTYEADGYEPVARTVGTIGFSAETVVDNAETWGPRAGLLGFVDSWLTLLGLGLGLVLVAAGSVLVLSRGGRRPTRDDAEDLGPLPGEEPRERVATRSRRR
ncbi:DUF3068 domain-containing protein [Phycicoccus sp. BSK3Z-2]|uniref:DUF3068 domain-containing protein n=1 Tax=Phycicoccus avicenniae TaxID=2828860 RepID=A0A941HZH9_9MICO|nr:DUF3068 domain-containing protein [Phycicoccus avicenniae]MBR7742189.1 DUF3068 domain-containing protein [Phycicoccus avicenniae]